MANPVLHWQIVTPNPEALETFYTSLFDWKCDADNALQYRRMDTRAETGIDGGIWPAPPEAHSFVQLHIQVDDVEAAITRATELGAQVIVPPQELPEGGEMAVLLDPEKVPFAVTTRS